MVVLRRARGILGAHRGLLAVLALGLALRVAVEVAYHPALFFGGDSSQYLKLALTGDPVGIAYERPSGYPLIVHAVFWLGRDLLALTILQHLAGLLTGVLTYALLGRLGAARGWAVAGAALVVLDAYAPALEQHVLAEAFFTPLLVGAMGLALPPGGAGRLAASGLLLGVAVTLRTEALFAVPVWLVYLAWAHRRLGPVAAAAAACALPLVAYAAWHDARTGRFGLTQANGWFLYARVGEIGDCRGVDVARAARPLCRRLPRDDRRGASYHLWDPAGTAHRAFGSLVGSPGRQRRINAILFHQAIAVIEARPWRYAGMVAADVARYFEPGVASRSVSDSAISFPGRGEAMGLDPAVARRWFPGLRARVDAPARMLQTYARWVHTPRWLLGLLACAAALAVALRLPCRREAFLLAGVPLAMLVGATATSDFILRYLIPTCPLLYSGGAVALADLLATARIRRGGRRELIAPPAAPTPTPSNR